MIILFNLIHYILSTENQHKKARYFVFCFLCQSLNMWCVFSTYSTSQSGAATFQVLGRHMWLMATFWDIFKEVKCLNTNVTSSVIMENPCRFNDIT